MVSLGFRRRQVPEEDRPSNPCKAEMQGSVLHVKCSECSGAQDLKDPACLQGVLAFIENQCTVRRVIIHGDWDLAFNGPALAVLLSIADVRRNIEAWQRTARNQNDECVLCRHGPIQLSGRLLQSSPFQWRGMIASIPSLSDSGGDCQQCTKETRAHLEQIEALARDIEKRMYRSAFKVVEGGPVE